MNKKSAMANQSQLTEDATSKLFNHFLAGGNPLPVLILLAILVQKLLEWPMLSSVSIFSGQPRIRFYFCSFCPNKAKGTFENGTQRCFVFYFCNPLIFTVCTHPCEWCICPRTFVGIPPISPANWDEWTFLRRKTQSLFQPNTTKVYAPVREPQICPKYTYLLLNPNMDNLNSQIILILAEITLLSFVY